MRVISQDGTMDVPYENVVLYQDEKEIMCIFSGVYIGRKLARYSTTEKTEKVMEMLRKSYENNEFYHHMSTTDTFKDVASLLNNEKFNEVTRECFQFPQDDEIEV
jgi:N-acetylglutamate synthase/N-acetylornithine aminotransferase|nr:MAG TPA: hypothetical protein [Bacteriophage sp.]